MSFTREVLTAHIGCLEDALTRTKRALWLARAERAKCEYNFIRQHLSWIEDEFDVESLDSLQDKWRIVERKCRQYADKFKEEK